MSFVFVDPWHLFLPREGGHVISLMGAGGKTSLLGAFARLYGREGIPTVLTTTTRTEPLPEWPVVELADLDAGAGVPDKPCFFLRDGVDAAGKWRGLDPAAVDELGGRLSDRVVLVEADGAGKKPVKLHRDDEPVWPERTSLAVVVLGSAALGGSVGSVLFRHGRFDSGPVSVLPAQKEWDWDDFEQLLLGAGGYLDRVPANVPVVLAVTGMGTLRDSIGLFGFIGRAMEHPRLALTLFAETDPEASSFRTACRHEAEADG